MNRKVTIEERRIRRERIAAGMCSRCGEHPLFVTPAGMTVKFCQACRAYNSARISAGWVSSHSRLDDLGPACPRCQLHGEHECIPASAADMPTGGGSWTWIR